MVPRIDKWDVWNICKKENWVEQAGRLQIGRKPDYLSFRQELEILYEELQELNIKSDSQWVG